MGWGGNRTRRQRERVVKAASNWLMTSGQAFQPESGRTGSAHLKHYTARFSVWGEGPPLVLIPGLAEAACDLLGPLARGAGLRDHQVISYQLRGEDDCFALRQRFDLLDLVNDLSELLDWLGLERPALMGVSFGGVLALELAIRRPGRVRSLLLQGVGSRFESSLLQQVAGMVLSRYPLPADNPFVNQFFNLFFGSKQKPGPLFDFVTRQCWQTDQSVMAHRFQLAGGAGRFHRPTGCRSVACRCCWPATATCLFRREDWRKWPRRCRTLGPCAWAVVGIWLSSLTLSAWQQKLGRFWRRRNEKVLGLCRQCPALARSSDFGCW